MSPAPYTLAALHRRHEQEEREHVRAALVASDWTLTDAAAVLGIAISTLQRLLHRHERLALERAQHVAKRLSPTDPRRYKRGRPQVQS